jgi:membrane-bound lytic murein transglycosylase B
VPADLLTIYQEAALNCPGLPWPVVAGIGKAETDHNRAPGVSDAGAVGPMQFLPATWQQFQADGDGDGAADIESEADSIHGAVRLLCAGGGDDPATLQDAIFSYNRSDEYVAQVLETARSYTTGTIDAP